MRMSIKSRVRLFQLMIGLSVLMMAVIVYMIIRSTDYHLKRVKLANHQLDAITLLIVSANRFSEQIAEFLLIGEPERPEFESAKTELETGFDRLQKATAGEAEFLKARGGDDNEGNELFRIERLRTLYRELNQSVDQVFALRSQGRQDEAILLFRLEIENRLDAEFENILIAAKLDEKEEVEEAERDAEALWQQLTWIATITTLAVLAAGVGPGLSLERSLTRPIKLLTEGTEAIGRGELDHRISYDSRDELGTLAHSFNEMAARREEQRALLLEARDNLEWQVAKRTDELAAANIRLTELDRLRVQFLADISHELRTPLTALRGEAEITLRHGPKPEAIYRDALGRIVAQTLEMGRLVDDLLFLARSETDAVRFDVKRTALEGLIVDAVREGEVLAQSKGITLEAMYPSEPVWIEVDPQRLRQALMILLDNAIKYSPPGRSVRVRLAATNGHGEITVRDQGAGIAAEDLPHVFERFYRGQSSNISSRPGSGLGLAIAKWLVEKHAGEIALTSEAGCFTEVRIRIPRVQVVSLVENSAGGG